MIYTHIAAALLGAAIAATGAWKVQGWRLGNEMQAMKAQLAAEKVAAVEEARATERRNFKRVQDAQRKSAAAAQAAAAAASAARSERDGLRDELAAAHSANSRSLASCNRHSSTLGGLLNQCAASLGGMAEKAQGHADDVRLLLDSWPEK